MRSTARLLATGGAIILALVGRLGGAAASEPVRPDQHFIGLVNGRRVNAFVYTVCGGPAGSGRTGPVAGGQGLAVARMASMGGFTGPLTPIHAWFRQDGSPGGPQQVVLTSYRTPVPIPSAVRVPCDGAGTVEFSSCPRLAPCVAGWVPTRVKVRFVNIAV